MRKKYTLGLVNRTNIVGKLRVSKKAGTRLKQIIIHTHKIIT